TKKHIAEARMAVASIDKDVTHLVSNIIKAGKTPIIIGGGHNNAYGNIKGASLAYKNKINVVNFDAHSDFRAEEGRHSGNGFSYAYAHGFLKNYAIFGLHENYTSDKLFKSFDKNKHIKYITYEALEIRKQISFKNALASTLNHINENNFGIEIDCDAIENIPSSAATPSGFSTKQARQFTHYFGKQTNASYLHICEAAPTKKTETRVGKLISYLITDFIRANGNYDY
ncbi:MAG: formimidoylglutamase, partial [Winogradskyella sp.]